MENIVQIQYIISAFIGFLSAIIMTIIASIFKLRIAEKNRKKFGDLHINFVLYNNMILLKC